MKVWVKRTSIKTEKLFGLSIVLVLLPFFSFSQINQADSNGLRQGLWKKQQPTGQLIYEGNFKDGNPVGEWKRYHSGGRVKAIINYQQNSDSAFTQLFDEFGKKVAEGNYVNQKKEGNWIYFSGNRIIAEEQFKLDLKDGTSLKYYDSGELMEKIDWEIGLQQGNYQIYYKSGQPYLQCKMTYDQRNGLCLIHTQKGKLELEANYKNNLRHGEWKFYNNGKFQYLLKYYEGRILNPEVRDSIANIEMQNIEKNRGTITDPETFMEDPSGYMMKMKIY